MPLRFTYDNNYFTDPHQGIPTEGYDVLVQRLLAGSDVLLSTCYRDFVEKHPHIAHKTVYTGTIDGFFRPLLRPPWSTAPCALRPKRWTWQTTRATPW